MLDQGPMSVERWKETLHAGIKRWKGVQQERQGLGDAFVINGKTFVESHHTMRVIQVKIRLPKTHQARAIQLGMAQAARNTSAAKEGWVEVDIESDETLQNALTLARQGYMEAER